jgi:hypothetical protein
MSREVFRVALNLTVVLLSLAAVVCVVVYWRERRLLAARVRQIAPAAAPNADTVLRLARFVFANVARGPDPTFVSRLFAVLGGSPLAILRDGGCCSGTHRLFIACLDTVGIRAAQIAVYPGHGDWAHCMAQVSLADQTLLLDVDYGVCYRHPNGGSLDLFDLRNGVEPTIEIFADGLVTPTESSRGSRGPGYPNLSYYRFDYRKTRTANWTRTWWRRLVYAVLHWLSRGRIDQTFMPPMLEWPQILLSIGIVTAALSLLTVRCVL